MLGLEAEAFKPKPGTAQLHPTDLLSDTRAAALVASSPGTSLQ